MDDVEKAIDHGGSDAVYEFFCEMCHEDGLHVEAEGFCADCSEYLCEQCITHHKKNRLSRYHKVFGSENMPKDTPPCSDGVRRDISTMCKQHQCNKVEFFCRYHTDFICSVCVSTDHRSCTGTKTIIEKSRDIFDSTEFKDFNNSLRYLNQQARDIIKTAHDELVASDQCFSEVIDSVRRFKVEMISLIDELEANICVEINRYKEDYAEQEGNIFATCTTLQGTIDKITSEFESLQSANRVCQTYIRMKETKAEVKDIKSQLKQVRKGKDLLSFTFVPNHDLRQLLTSLGRLSVVGRVDSTPVIKTESPASFLQDINLKDDRDSSACLITGAAVISNGKLVIVDESNCTLKVVDTGSMDIITVVNVPENPCDITAIKDDKVAVTFLSTYTNNENTIFVINMANAKGKFTVEREINVNDSYRCMAYSKNQLIVINSTTQKLEILDMQGKVIQIIEKDKDGNALFKCPYSVCVSSDGDTLYVSDYDADRVISLRRDGDVKAIYKDSNLKGPTKVCLDHRGNVFVCGYTSKNVHMITPQCTKIKEILTQIDTLHDVMYTVSYCRQTRRLFVGMGAFDSVKVFQLS